MAPSLVGSISVVESTSGNSSANVTVPSGATLAIISYHKWHYSDGAPSALSLGGSSVLSELVNQSVNTSYEQTGVYYQVNPSSGTQTLAWTFADDPLTGCRFYIVYLSGTDTSSPIRGSGVTTGSGGAATPPFSSDTSDLCLAAASGGNVLTLTNGGQDEEVNGSYNSCYAGIASKAGVSSTTTMTVTIDVGASGSIVGFSVKPGAGSTTAPPTTAPPATPVNPNNVSSSPSVSSVVLTNILGSVVWGHDTSVDEDFTRDFSSWTGTATVSGSNDSEKVRFNSGEYLESPVWHIGSGSVTLAIDKYGSGFGSITVKYKQGSTIANCQADAWHDYVPGFTSNGFIQVRLER